MKKLRCINLGPDGIIKFIKIVKIKSFDKSYDWKYKQ